MWGFATLGHLHLDTVSKIVAIMYFYKTVLFIVFLLGVVTLLAQVNDYTPPGEWTSLSPSSIDGGDALLIRGYTEGGHVGHYLLEDDVLFNLDPDSLYNQMLYLNKVGQDRYFSYEDKNDNIGIVYTDDSSISEVPYDKDYLVNVPIQMSDGSLLTNLIDNSQPVGWRFQSIISETGVIILDSIPYEVINIYDIPNQSRVYTTCVDTSNTPFKGPAHLAYFDIHTGYTLTDIRARNIDLISKNPGDSIHVLITNDTEDLIESKIFRVEGETFNEIIVPGGSYDQIDLIFRNEDTGTSLFELTDFAGNVKLARRQMGSWTDLTSTFKEVDNISSEIQSGDEVFLDVNVGPSDQELWYYQSTAYGDTLINVTPFGDPFSSIRYLPNSFDFPLSFLFKHGEEEFIYAYFNGQTTLLAPPYQLVNPDGIPAKYLYMWENGVYTFQYYNSDSSETYEHMYHQMTPGGELTLINDNTDTEYTFPCSSDDFVLLKSHYFDDTEKFLYYNLDTVVELVLPERDSANRYELVPFGEEGCMIEKQGDQIDSSYYTYIFSGSELVDVTHPRFRNLDTDDDKEYKMKEFVSYSSLISNHSIKQLWGLTTEDRYAENCNTDIKYFYEDAFVPAVDELGILAKEVFVQTQFLNGIHTNKFTVEKSIEMLPGTEVVMNAIFIASIKECEEQPGQ